ncbi:hypothetical protein ONZ45_g17995 [Pleurotus djamor]|nr:hypothetical protein ONZ45_g17995 [Pleurotus djamor]
MMMNSLLFLVFSLILSFANAQTQTTINPAGESIVVVVTVGIDGLPTTSIIQTLPDADTPPTTATTPPTTPTTTTTTPALTTVTPPPQQQGPVGQPGPTGAPGAVTPFTYTTVINGVTIQTTDVFTPTAPATTPSTAPATGTILDYSQWLSQYAGGAAQTPFSGAPRVGIRRSMQIGLIAIVLAVAF